MFLSAFLAQKSGAKAFRCRTLAAVKRWLPIRPGGGQHLKREWCLSYNENAHWQQALHHERAAAAFRQTHQNIGLSYQAKAALLSWARQDFSC
jgi:hypothetical protein